MPAKRVIPCLDVTGGRVVKGVRFQDLRDAGDPAELAAAYDREGADEIVFLDITARRRDGDSGWEVYSHGGRRATGRDAMEWAIEGEKLGAGEILLTSMDTDGTHEGYDLELTRAISDAVRLAVI